MKWAPEDRLNAYAAAVLASQPDPPRDVSLVKILSAYSVLAGVLVVPAALFVGAMLVDRRLLAFAVIAAAGVLLIGAEEAFEMSKDTRALQSGVAGTGEVVRVDPGFRASKIVTLRVNAAGVVTETQIVRSGAANVLVPEDTVQLLLDPQTRQVILVVGLLKPSPLYAPS
ncbi:MAG TPA: hypothetical protein VFK22_07440 [Candidatus Dormibacteraeota bacterium]|nr:hypothetical protein [Candidatus Dormibacteraeota bacterium]